MSSQSADYPANLSLEPEGQINHLTSVLKRSEVQKKGLEQGVSLIPDVFFNIDRDGRLEGTVASRKGEIASLALSVRKPVRWVAMHIRMGSLSLAGLSLLGVVVKTQAPVATTSRLCIRSGTEGGFHDFFFPKHVVSFAEESSHIDLIRLGGTEPPLPEEAPWRELIMFFRPEEQSIGIGDLKVFTA